MKAVMLVLIVAGLFAGRAEAQVRVRQAEVGLSLNLGRSWTKADAARAEGMASMLGLARTARSESFVTAINTKTGALLSGGVHANRYPFSVSDLIEGGEGWLRRATPSRADFATLEVGRKPALRLDRDTPKGGVTLVIVGRGTVDLQFLISGSRSVRDKAIAEVVKGLRFRKKHTTAESFPWAEPLRGRSFGVTQTEGRWLNTLQGVEVRDTAPWFLMRPVEDWGHAPKFSADEVSLVDVSSRRRARVNVRRIAPIEGDFEREKVRLEEIRGLGVKEDAKHLFAALALGQPTKFYRLPVPEPTVAGVVIEDERLFILIFRGPDVPNMNPADIAEFSTCVHRLDASAARLAMGNQFLSPRAQDFRQAHLAAAAGTLRDRWREFSWKQPADGHWIIKAVEEKKFSAPRFRLEDATGEGRIAVYYEVRSDWENLNAVLTQFLERSHPKAELKAQEEIGLWEREVLDVLLVDPESKAETSVMALVSGTSDSPQIIIIEGGFPSEPSEFEWKRMRRAMKSFDFDRAKVPTKRFSDRDGWSWYWTRGVAFPSEAIEKKASFPRAEEATGESGLLTWDLVQNRAELAWTARKLAPDDPGDTALFEREIAAILESRRYGRRLGKQRDVERSGARGVIVEFRDKNTRQELILLRRRSYLWICTPPPNSPAVRWLETIRFEE